MRLLLVRRVNTVLAILTILTVTTVAIVACLPTSTSEKSPPTNTPRVVIVYDNNTPFPVELEPVPLTPYVLIDNLRSESDEYEATKEALTEAGKSTDTMDDPITRIFITVDSFERANQVTEFLESHSVEVSSKNYRTPHEDKVVVAYVPRSLLKKLSYMEGIIRIVEPAPPSNESSRSDLELLDLDEISGLTT